MYRRRLENSPGNEHCGPGRGEAVGSFVGRQNRQLYTLRLEELDGGEFRVFASRQKGEKSIVCGDYVLFRDSSYEMKSRVFLDYGSVPDGLPVYFSDIAINYRKDRGQGLASVLCECFINSLEERQQNLGFVHVVGFSPDGLEKIMPRYKERGYRELSELCVEKPWMNVLCAGWMYKVYGPSGSES